MKRFLLLLCLFGCAQKTDYKQWHPCCHFCGKTWEEYNLEQGYVPNHVRAHIDECRRRQGYELIKVKPKLDTLP